MATLLDITFHNLLPLSVKLLLGQLLSQSINALILSFLKKAKHVRFNTNATRCLSNCFTRIRKDRSYAYFCNKFSKQMGRFFQYVRNQK